MNFSFLLDGYDCLDLVAKLPQDSTLITTASGKKFGDDPGDWKWWDSSVPSRLRKLYAEEE